MRNYNTRRTLWCFTLAFLFTLSSSTVYGQLGKGQLKLNLGPTMGFPIIKDSPEGSKPTPGIGVSSGLQWNQPLKNHWSVSIGARYTSKKGTLTSPINRQMNAANDIKLPFPIPISLPNVMINVNGELKVNFDNEYIEFPIFVHHQVGAWQVGLGYQYSTLLKGQAEGRARVTPELDLLPQKVTIGRPFTETDNIRPNENGIVFAITKDLNDRVSMGVNGTVSLNGLFIQPIEEFNNPRNVYGNVFVSVKLFGYK